MPYPVLDSPSPLPGLSKLFSGVGDVTNRKEVPFARHPFEGPDATVSEIDAGAHDQVLDRAGDEHLPRFSELRDASRDVHGDPSKFSLTELTLARMSARPDR